MLLATPASNKAIRESQDVGCTKPMSAKLCGADRKCQENFHLRVWVTPQSLLEVVETFRR